MGTISPPPRRQPCIPPARTFLSQPAGSASAGPGVILGVESTRLQSFPHACPSQVHGDSGSGYRCPQQRLGTHYHRKPVLALGVLGPWCPRGPWKPSDWHTCAGGCRHCTAEPGKLLASQPHSGLPHKEVARLQVIRGPTNAAGARPRVTGGCPFSVISSQGQLLGSDLGFLSFPTCTG